MEIGEYEMKEAINYAVINLLLSHSLTEKYFKVQDIFVVIWSGTLRTRAGQGIKIK